MKNRICGIYKITSITGSIYIGQSINIHKRWDSYKKHFAGSQRRLNNSFKKHGTENHIFEIIEECSRELLNEREIYWIEFYDTFDTEHGLNLLSGGLVRTPSEETRKKQSESAKGNTSASGQRTEEFKRIISKANKGKKRAPFTKEHLKNMSESQKKRPPKSEETRRKLSEAGKRREPPTEETRKKNSEAHKGNKYGLGYKHTEEFKREQSERARGNKYAVGNIKSEKGRRSISEANKGNKYALGSKKSEEGRKNISDTNKGNKYALGYKYTEEQLKNISKVMIGNTNGSGNKGKPKSKEARLNMSKSQIGKKKSLETIRKGEETKARIRLEKQLKQHEIQSIKEPWYKYC